MANLKKAVSFIVSRNNTLKGTFNTHPSLLSLRKTSSVLEVGIPKTILSPFYSTWCYNPHKLFKYGRFISENKNRVSEPTAVMCTALVITRLCYSGQIDTAFTVLEEVVRMGWKPNVDTYTIVIDNLFDKGRVDYALKLFKKMAFHHGIPDDDVSYSVFLHAIRMLSRRRDEISKLLTDMEDEGKYVGLRTFNIFVDAYCKEGRMEDAESLVKLMIQRNIFPNATTYRLLIDGYYLKGDMSKSREVFDLMRCRGVDSNVAVYNSLFKGYCKYSMIEEVIPLFHEMMQSSAEELFNVVPKPDERTYLIVLEGLCFSNRVEEAVSLFQSLVDNKKLNSNVVVYNTIIYGANKSGRLDIGRSLYNEMTTIKGLQPNAMTYVAMIYGFCEQGLAAEAKEWFFEMKEKGLWPDEATCMILQIGFTKTKQVDMSKMLLHEMVARGFETAKPIFSGDPPAPSSSLCAKEGVTSLEDMWVSKRDAFSHHWWWCVCVD